MKSKKRKNDSINNLSKKQVKDLKQFGQLHPIDERYYYFILILSDIW